MCNAPTDLRSVRLLAILIILLVCSACGQSDTVTPTVQEAVLEISTPDPAVAQTLQAEIALTAAFIATFDPVVTPTGSVLPTFDLSLAAGTPVSQLVGLCPLPEGYSLHVREGFCISAPEAWSPINVDGGLAASLNTTPDRTIFLRPDWATSNQICHLFVYIASEESAAAHLQTRYNELSVSNELPQLTDVTVQALGDLKFPGFFWTLGDGSGGAAFADMIGPNQLLHISFGGTQCAAADLTAVINTLRIQPTQR